MRRLSTSRFIRVHTFNHANEDRIDYCSLLYHSTVLPHTVHPDAEPPELVERICLQMTFCIQPSTAATSSDDAVDARLAFGHATALLATIWKDFVEVKLFRFCW